MRISALISITILFVLLITACDEELFTSSKSIAGSGELIKIEKDIRGVSRFEFSQALDVEIVSGNNEYAAVTIDENLMEYLIFKQNGSTLTIGLENNNSYSDYEFNAEIVVPGIRKIEAAGAVSTAIYNFSSDENFEANFSGASELEGELTASNVILILTGASTVNLSGSCKNLNIDASGASEIDLEQFESGNVDINLTGASAALIFSNGTIKANLSGASILSYMGDAEITSITSSGLSIVRHLSGL